MLASVSSTYTDVMTSVFSETIAAKAWFATAAGFFALVQITTAARIFGKLQRVIRLPHETVKRIHRWSGRLVFLLTLPVIFHCVFILGFKTTDTRVTLHCIAGSFIYGAFAVQVFLVHDPAHPRRPLPLRGGTLVSVLATLSWTSAY